MSYFLLLLEQIFRLVLMNLYLSKYLNVLKMFLCGSVVEHCVISAKGCWFDSQGTHILMKMYNLNAIVSHFGSKRLLNA